MTHLLLLICSETAENLGTSHITYSLSVFMPTVGGGRLESNVCQAGCGGFWVGTEISRNFPGGDQPRMPLCAIISSRHEPPVWHYQNEAKKRLSGMKEYHYCRYTLFTVAHWTHWIYTSSKIDHVCLSVYQSVCNKSCYSSSHSF